MALHSFRGGAARLEFGLLAVCWLGTAFAAYQRVRSGDFGARRRWMIRSFALTFGAVTLRIYLPASQAEGIPI